MTPSLRCFVALWPDPRARAELDVLSHRLQEQHPRARRMRRENLHLTLAFIGELAEPSAQRVAAALAALQSTPFTWTLDEVGGFARARVVWAGGHEPRLAGLARESRECLDRLEVAYDRKPFVAHVTLLRDVIDVPGVARVAPIEWHVDRPVLVVSERGLRGAIRYRTWGAGEPDVSAETADGP
ncbi:MAG TPA: RNA 2',3'-cyclic phosphodiesterase [Burkholderiaceae bacterium]